MSTQELAITITPPATLAAEDIAERCDECEGRGSVTCDTCRGRGGTDCTCEDCGHTHTRRCADCESAGTWHCESCYGAGCMAAARAWAADVLPGLIPAAMARTLIKIAPRLDAAGLPRFAVCLDGTVMAEVAATVVIEARRSDRPLARLLRRSGFARSGRAGEPRAHMDLWWRKGPPVRMSRRAESCSE